MPLTPEQIAKIQNHSQERKERAKKLTHKKEFATVYIPEYVILVRFYTDRDGEYIRSIWQHKVKIGDTTYRAQCLGPRECEICKLLATLSKWDGDWKFGSREIGICYAWIDEYNGPESKFVKVHEPVLLMGNYKLANSLGEFISELGDREEVKAFFTPETPYFRTKLRLRDKGKAWDFNTIPSKAITIPPLPENFPPLSECIFRFNEGPTDEVVEKFKELIYESHEEARKKEIDRVKTEHKAAVKAAVDDDQEDKPIPQDAPHPKCPSSFGHKPGTFNPVCLQCMVDEDCDIETAKNKESK